MPETTQQDKGLVQRGLVLLGGMTALVAIVLLILLRTPEPPSKVEPSPNDRAVVPSAPGWEIRYNAAITLARRGSAKTPWPLIREMLDDEQQRRNFRMKLKSGVEVADEESALRTVQNALAAVAQWHKQQDSADLTAMPPELQLVYDQIDRLAQGTNNPVRVQADRVRQTILRK